MTCVFCSILAGRVPATIVCSWPAVLAFQPLRPVTDGHVLVIPRWHVADAGVMPDVTGKVMAAASELAAELPAANIITSKGRAATQPSSTSTCMCFRGTRAMSSRCRGLRKES